MQMRTPEDLIKQLGLTMNLLHAGYIFADGALLNFKTRPGEKALEHRLVGNIAEFCHVYRAIRLNIGIVSGQFRIGLQIAAPVSGAQKTVLLKLPYLSTRDPSEPEISIDLTGWNR